MSLKEKSFNFTVLFILLYAILAIMILAFIWWPKGNSKLDNTSVSYESVDGKQKAKDIYTSKVMSLLCENDLPQLYEKLNDDYKKSINLNENNYKTFLEGASYISDSINILSTEVSIQGDTYIYRFKYSCNNKTCYVNLIETRPYEYTLSFEQETIPNVDSSTTSSKVSTVDDVTYTVSKTTIRDKGITYQIQITNNSDKTVYYNFDNITNVSVILSDERQCNLGAAIVSSDEDTLTPNSSLKKDFFFAVSSADQYKIKSMIFRNIKIGDEKKDVTFDI